MILISKPATALTVGIYTYVTPKPIPAALSSYQIVFSNAADFPKSGDVAIISVLHAADGVNHLPHTGWTFGGDPGASDPNTGWPSNTNTVTVSAPPWPPGNNNMFGDNIATRVMKVQVQILQPCTFGFVLQSVAASAVP